MISRDIWGTAQLLNAIICLCMCNFLAIISIPFALICGIPALFLFKVWLAISRHLNISAWLRMSLSAIVLPLCTALCSLGFKYVMDDSLTGELMPMAIAPIAATVVATLLNTKRLISLKKENDYLTENH